MGCCEACGVESAGGGLVLGCRVALTVNVGGCDVFSGFMDVLWLFWASLGVEVGGAAGREWCGGRL
jgi:hypothetical protein